MIPFHIVGGGRTRARGATGHGVAAAVAAIAVLATAPTAPAAQRLPVVLPQCVAGPFAPGIVTPAESEGYGPTDVNAITANRALTVGLNRSATVTVLRWPNASFYEQVKYFTLDRDRPRFGALENEGAFIGVVLGGRTRWLRDMRVAQRWASQLEDRVVTTFRDDGAKLEVVVRDVTALRSDVLHRSISVRALPGASRRPDAVIAYENFNLVVSKVPALPGQDWCVEEQNVDDARYEGGLDAIVHEKSGVDVSTGLARSVAVAMGFRGRSDAHQVGGDAFEPSALPDGRAGATLDAYLDAADGALQGNGRYSGQTTGALRSPLRFGRDGTARADLYLAAGADARAAGAALRFARERPRGALAAEKRAWLRRLMARATMPDTRDPKILALARRALVLLLVVSDPSGPIVASTSSQPPYNVDWPRDGAFFNHALDRASFHDIVARHNRFYVQAQATETRQPPGSLGVPPGAWAMNYYADGVVGGPIPWEIDEVGFGAWTLWDHFTFVRDRDYLREVYPAIRRAGDLLVSCRDPRTGLQCRATEDDNFNIGQQQTLTGAMSVRLGLESARLAARELGRADDEARFRARREELDRAVDELMWDPATGSYTAMGGEYLEYPIWPTRFHEESNARIRSHAEYLWRTKLAPAFQAPNGPQTSGLYESKGLIALARVYRATDRRKLARVRRGLRWISRLQATPDTGILGETWRVKDGRVLTFTATPHLWEQTLFYLAALDAYGERR